MVYSAIASVISILFTNIVGLILYEDIILKESKKRKKYMVEALIKLNPDMKSKYQIKLNNGFLKIRTMLILIGKNIKQLYGINN